MRAKYWLVALIRALVAFVFGGLIALDQNHTSLYGLIMFGVFAIVNGAIVAWGGYAQADPQARLFFLIEGVISGVAGIVALIRPTAGLGMFFFVVTGWALLTGVAEGYLGVRARRRTASVTAKAQHANAIAGAEAVATTVAADVTRDWVLVGGFTVVLGIVFLLIPPTDPVLAVGLLGAYLAMVGVYLGIGALSLKWAAPAGSAPSSTDQKPGVSA